MSEFKYLSGISMRMLSLSAGIVFGFSALITSADEQDPPTKKPAPIDYKRDIVPILEAKCIRCHTTKKAGGKLDMTTRTAMFKGGISGPAVVPGKVDKSFAVEMIHFNEMPPKKTEPRVTKDELKLLKTWIEEGARDDK